MCVILSLPIDAGHINKYVDEFRTDFIMFHFDWITVSRNVDFAYHIEEEGFLNLRIANKIVNHC